MGNNSPTNPLNSGHNPPFDPLDVLKDLEDLIPEDLSDLSLQEQEIVQSLLGSMFPANLNQFGVPLEAQSDRDLLKHLQNQVQTANTTVDLLAQRAIGKNHLQTMRQLELQLVAMIPNISDLEQALDDQIQISEQPTNRSQALSSHALQKSPVKNIEEKVGTHNHPHALARIKAVRFWLNLQPQTRWTICVCVVAAFVPISIRWAGPMLLHQAEQAGLTKMFSHSTSTVKTIDGNTWIIAPPNQPIQSVQLAGIEAIDSAWIAQANTILRMIVHASDNQVSVTMLPHSSRALLRLPTGLLLQEILVRQGFAKLDANQLKSLPKNVVTQLEQAQAQAKAQHQHVWNDE